MSLLAGWVGASLERVEDDGLLTGTEPFVADVSLPGQLSACIVRSPVAHGVLRSIDLRAARASPGVVAVFTAQDMVDDLGSIPTIRPRLSYEESLKPYFQPVLARGKVRFVGEPVAVVVAKSRALAEDAADLVVVEVESLDPVLDASAADEAQSLFEGLPNRLDVRGSYGDVAAAVSQADVVLSARLSVGRHSGVPMETRGLVADWDAQAGRLTIYGSTKVPHHKRHELAIDLGLDERQIRLLALTAGGAFGIKGEVYPEDVVIPWACKQLGRPVAWIEDRREHLISANHSRQQIHDATIAADGDGRIVALRTQFRLDAGAYVRTVGVRLAELTIASIPGPYDIPHYEAVGSFVLTNKTPTGTYRSPGGFEASFVCDRMIDLLAARLGRSAVEIRRLNLVRPDQMPYERPLHSIDDRIVLESADYRATFDRVVDAAGASSVARRRAAGERVGLGTGAYLEKSGLGPWEAASVSVAGSGAVTVRSGATPIGQGLLGVLAQIAADSLGIPPDEIEAETVDTDALSSGRGTYASRSTIMAGNAVRLAALSVIEAGRPFAADALGVDPVGLEFVDGEFVCTSGASLGLRAVAGVAARANGVGLSAVETYRTDAAAFSFGAVAAVVCLDAELGVVRVEQLALGYDVGRAVNPRLVHGQLHGAAAQALGGALLEEFSYDASGNPRVASLMDYLLPSLADAPSVTVLLEENPTDTNPLGVRGAGEAGVCGVAAAIVGAVEDALGRPGAIRAVPVTPEVVWRVAHSD